VCAERLVGPSLSAALKTGRIAVPSAAIWHVVSEVSLTPVVEQSF
jgi:hypothetical protein